MRVVKSNAIIPGVFIYLDEYRGYYIRELERGTIIVDEMRYYTIAGDAHSQWWINPGRMNIIRCPSWDDWEAQALRDPEAFLAYLLVL